MLTEDLTRLRRLPIEGTYNMRDLGGYRTAGGRKTRWQTLLRADKLDCIGDAGERELLAYGVRTVIDLRYTPEVEAEPDAFALSTQVQYLHMPLYELSSDAQLPRVPDDLEDLYRLILDHRSMQVGHIFSILAAKGTLPAVVHCTAGKDRTGIIAALALGAVGVSHETIIRDYMLSAEYLEPLYVELREFARRNGLDADWYDRLLLCQPDIMRHTLEHLDAHYGGIQEYLLEAGLSPQQLRRLQDAFVE